MQINIIMPVHNTNPEYIEQSLNSIVSQSSTLWKLIIVDDCSDNHSTLDYLSSINSNKITLVRNDINLGEMMARKEGAKKLDQDCLFVAFMDSDDIMLPRRIETQHHFMLENRDIDVVGAQLQIFYDPRDGYNIPPHLSYTNHPYSVNDYIFSRHWCFNNPTSFMRRHIIEDFNFNHIRSCQDKFGISRNKYGDYIFYAMLAKAGFKIRNLPDILLMYRHNTNQTTNMSNIPVAEQLQIHKNIRKWIFNANK